jgi:hypothetical protein
MPDLVLAIEVIKGIAAWKNHGCREGRMHWIPFGGQYMSGNVQMQKAVLLGYPPPRLFCAKSSK